MHKITFSLDEKSISAAIVELKRYRKKIESAALTLTHRLTEQGVSLAQLNASFMNAYDTGVLVNSIESRYKGKAGFVISNARHAAFVEFGTGVVGRGKPHPISSALGWRYDINNHGELGWWYIGNDGESHWTKGMPSRPFMYETIKMLEPFVVPLAKEAFA